MPQSQQQQIPRPPKPKLDVKFAESYQPEIHKLIFSPSGNLIGFSPRNTQKTNK